MKNFTRSFKQINKNDASVAGGKGASLGEMTQIGIPVPSGFVILSNAFGQFLKETDLNVEIDSILDNVNLKEIHTVDDASEKIKFLILNAEMPKIIVKEIKISFKKLKTHYVAVRSSATAEDSSSAAWAGQLESYLNTTEKDLLANVKKCWASLFTPRAIFYRFEKNLHKQKISVAVVIQKMVESKVSGIAFSAHPATQDRNQLIIEASFGLGEAIVGGEITPDSYVVEKGPRRIIDINVNIQNRGLYRAKIGGNEWRSISKKIGEKQVLSNKQILQLSELILKIENHYGFPVDVEWAFEKGKFYIVQSRPITTLTAAQGKKEELILEKGHAREMSLFKVGVWLKSVTSGVKNFIGDVGLPGTLIRLEKGENLVKVYYYKKDLEKLFKTIGEKAKSMEFIKKIIKEFLGMFNEFLPYLEKKKIISSKEELAWFYNKYKDYYTLLGIIFIIPNLTYLPSKNLELSMGAREKTEKYDDVFDDILRDGLRKIYKGKYREDEISYILPEEVFGNKKIIRKKLRERFNGYAYYRNKFYVGNEVERLVEEKNIKFDDEQALGANDFNSEDHNVENKIFTKEHSREYSLLNLRNSNKKIKYVKEFARNYSLFQVVAYTEFNRRSAPEFNIVVDTGHPLFVYAGGSLADIYYPEGELKKIFGQFGKIAANVDYFHGAVLKFFKVIDEIKPYFEKQKSARNLKELRYIYELYMDFGYGEAIIWVAPLVENLSKELKTKALSVREQTQNLTSLRDELFDYNLSKLFPELGELTHFVLPNSIFGGKIVSELLREATEHQKGFVFFDGNIYTGQQDEILRKLNIELEDSLPTEKVNSINGQSASQGMTRGRVKIILTNKDIYKVSMGDILVSPMTRPDFIPAMKKAAAFVTDEGGITCHAAIVSREMKKPCIVGTKIATKVLKDGDLVEVDANHGIVKILKKVKN